MTDYMLKLLCSFCLQPSFPGEMLWSDIAGCPNTSRLLANKCVKSDMVFKSKPVYLLAPFSSIWKDAVSSMSSLIPGSQPSLLSWTGGDDNLQVMLLAATAWWCCCHCYWWCTISARCHCLLSTMSIQNNFFYTDVEHWHWQLLLLFTIKLFAVITANVCCLVCDAAAIAMLPSDCCTHEISFLFFLHAISATASCFSQKEPYLLWLLSL